MFRFWKDIQRLRKAGILISCEREVLGAGRFLQMRFFASADPLSCEHAHFEMYFLVIRPFDPALGEGGTLLYQQYSYVQPQSV